MDLMPKVDMREVIMPEPQEEEEILSPKQKIKPEEIFMGLEPQETVETTKETDQVKQKKKRPPMSEEHKEKLKQARGKALETRRKNAREKQEIKELQKLKKQNELEQLRADVRGERAPRVKKVVEEVFKEEVEEVLKPVEEKTVVETKYTKSDLLKAQQEAVLSYETARQYKKQKKKQEEEVARQEEQLMLNHNLKIAKTIERVRPTTSLHTFKQNPRYGDGDYWDNCF